MMMMMMMMMMMNEQMKTAILENDTALSSALQHIESVCLKLEVADSRREVF